MDAPWKLLTIEFKMANNLHYLPDRPDIMIKWPPIGNYFLSQGRYLVNRATWLYHYYKQNMRFQKRMHYENFALIKFKMAVYRPLFTFAWPIFGKPC